MKSLAPIDENLDLITKEYVDDNATIPLATETINQNTTLVTFGDSITYGYSATAESKRYPNVLAAAKGWSLTNYGVNGARMNDTYILDKMYEQVVGVNDNYTLLAGVNDSQAAGTNATLLDNFRGCLAAGIAWLALPDSYKIKAVDASKTGTWVNNPTVYSGMDYRSTTNGSTMSATVSGETVYIGHTRSEGVSGTFSVTIDGELMGNFETLTDITTRHDGSNYGAYLLRFPGLTNGPHDVTITVTSPTGSANAVYIDWIGGNGIPEEISGPNVWLGNCLRATDSYYSSRANHSDASVALHNAMIAEVATSLARDGLNVCLVDASSYIDRNTDLSGDGLHPSDAGHQKLADAFVAQMSSVVKTRDRGITVAKNTPWFTPALQNSWVEFSSNFDAPQYMKDANGIVHLRGLAKSGETGNANPLFTLPVGFRPKKRQHVPVISNGVLGIVEISERGGVGLYVGTNAYVSLEPITFFADK